jgi:hypothetical protein
MTARKTHCNQGHELSPENIYGVGRGRQCKICKKEWNRKYAKTYINPAALSDPEYYKKRSLRARHKVTISELNARITEQNGLCLLCNKPLALLVTTRTLGFADAPVIDHDHRCCSGRKSCGKCIRGILHRKCNAGLGLFRDDPVALRLAAEYLETYGIKL